jgi:Mn2+/Fe2+ NRAMP family transporter
VLLWSSRVWSTRDKLIGTLIVPGGLALIAPLALIAGSSSQRDCSGTATEVSPVFKPGHMHCVTTGGPSTAHTVLAVILLVVAVVGPIFTAIHLSRRAAAA